MASESEPEKLVEAKKGGLIKDKAESDLEASRKSLIDISKYSIAPDILKLITKVDAVKLRALPLYLNGQVLFVAMADPQNITAVDQLRRITKIHAVIPMYSSEQDILVALDRHYGLQEKVQDIVHAIQKERLEQITDADQKAPAEDEGGMDQAPVIKLVNHIILRAVQDRCSDIHLEPDEKLLRVRCRQDGVLKENYVFQKSMENAILARIKISSGMDIAEKRKPQDGRIRFKLESKQIDVRVSSLPTMYGENLVLRLLDKTAVRMDLESLGMEKSVFERFSKIIRYPHGIILVTGPTGSGKSTTLYAALSTVNDVEKNIVTVEDPIEYNLELIRQTQVNAKVGLTFASGLRSILRQDPDIIMVGEIRDTETAEIACQAALTGHLVFSTLHTNTACGSITRLADMGIQPFLIGSSVVGILAQRLVRRVCQNCKEIVKVPQNFLDELGVTDPQAVFYRGKGCDQCQSSGYLGRTAIHELAVISDKIREMIVARASEADIEMQAQKEGMKTLRDSGLIKALQGETTLEEVLKVSARG